MSLYKEKDVELFADKVDGLVEEVQKKTWNLLEPTGDFKMKIVQDVLEYIREHKRKLYGSYAHNKLVAQKNKNDAFLKELDIPDIDFYSPDPIYDLINICNTLQKKGYHNIVGREAQHEETYKIFVDEAEACDISYVPRNIYNKIPYQEIDGILYSQNSWTYIDYLRQFTDPMLSWEIKFEKRFKRFYIMQKYYPFTNIDKTLKIEKPDDKLVDKLLDKTKNFMVDSKTIMVMGLYAYNYYLQESGLSKYKIIDTPFYEFISSNYKEDAENLINKLKSIDEGVRFEEYYPYFGFTGFSTRIYYKSILIAIIYDNNNKCVPFNEVPLLSFEKGKVEKEKGKIKLLSFLTVLLYAQIVVMMMRTIENDKNKELYMSIVSHLIQMKHYYLDKKNKNIFSEGIFKDFIIECIGQTMSLKKETAERIRRRKELGKVLVFQYRPDDKLLNPKDESEKFKFKNSSGNIIRNPKNNKLFKNNTNDTEYEEEEIT